ncbi:MAG: NADH-quinone oxidoreductase subunit A [Anaerolineaceae bacterium]|nr:NADH-quinone oxidoreductase subunit A [Anaerolineaceae bacterium]
MIQEYFPLVILFSLAVFVGFFVIVLGSIFGPKRPTKNKAEPYESGMRPYGPGRRRMSIHYYLVAVLFIIFDIEVVFFLPWAVAARDLGMPGFILIFIFVVILEIAFVYVWKKGAMEWE